MLRTGWGTKRGDRDSQEGEVPKNCNFENGQKESAMAEEKGEKPCKWEERGGRGRIEHGPIADRGGGQETPF